MELVYGLSYIQVQSIIILVCMYPVWIWNPDQGCLFSSFSTFLTFCMRATDLDKTSILVSVQFD